jgi:DNA polymerase-3 subunit alpha
VKAACPVWIGGKSGDKMSKDYLSICHAAAYSVLAYQTAYLKYYYPKEYMAALLSSVLDSETKINEYIDECRRLGIKVLPPHINYSDSDFTVSGDSIRFGLLAIKNLGLGVIKNLVAERSENGVYTSFSNFCKRTQNKELNRRAIESLIKSGALDGLGNNRREMMSGLDDVFDSLNNSNRNSIDGQMSMFSEAQTEPLLPSMREYTEGEKLRMEKEVTGMYLSGHPMEEFRYCYERGIVASIGEIIRSAEGETDAYSDNQKVSVLGIVGSIKKKQTKSGSMMAFVTIEDISGSMEILIFSGVYENSISLLNIGSVLEFTGRISFTEEKDPKLICDTIESTDRVLKLKNNTADHKTKKSGPVNGLYIRVPSAESAVYKKAIQYIEIFGGNQSLYVFFEDRNKLMKAPDSLNVSINDVLTNALKQLLGEHNVGEK